MTTGRPPRSLPPLPARPPQRRSRARRGEGERLREEILEATAELLTERGSAAKVSTRAVAQRVGCSSPALYLHFPDKAALLYAVCEQQFQQLGASIDGALAGVDDPVERLRLAAHAYARFALDHPEQYRIMMMDETYDHDFSIDEFRSHAGMAAIVKALQDGMERGLFRPGDPMQTVLGLWGAIHGLISLRLAKPSIPLPPMDEMIDRSTDMIVEGLRTRL